MTARECLIEASALDDNYQRAINVFLDDFHRATRDEQQRMAEEPIETCGPLEGLIAGIISALFRDAGIDTPDWVGHIYSPNPFFAFPARSYALRIRLMLESPAPFKIRNVFVPENYLQRA
jgi:hypothetical protein